jgi:lipopolysaccharide/colanic/teichoic acid biosynthesis glycosyltransferase
MHTMPEPATFIVLGSGTGALYLRFFRNRYAEFKRAIDILFALPTLAVALPLIAILSVLVKLTSRGPAFYLQERVGRNGHVFQMVKLRTMTADAEKQTGPVWSSRDDPRETPLGRFLRRTHLDELPQLWNVLRGDMSLIGPRPERPFFVEKFEREIPGYVERLRVRPGITGWAQVNHDYDQTLDDVRRKLAYDCEYIERMGWGMDFQILVATATRMLGRRGGASGRTTRDA